MAINCHVHKHWHNPSQISSCGNSLPFPYKSVSVSGLKENKAKLMIIIIKTWKTKENKAKLMIIIIKTWQAKENKAKMLLIFFSKGFFHPQMCLEARHQLLKVEMKQLDINFVEHLRSRNCNVNAIEEFGSNKLYLYL